MSHSHQFSRHVFRSIYNLADLQFALTTSAKAARTEEDLKVQLQHTIRDSRKKDEVIEDLTAELRVKEARLEELKSQLKWQQLQFHNELERKDAKLRQVRRDSNGDHPDLIGDAREQEAGCNAQAGGVSQPSTPIIKVIHKPRKTASGLRQKMQKLKEVASSDSLFKEYYASRRVQTANDMSSKGKPNFVSHRASLPGNYKATVASLPPIVSRSASVTRLPERQSQMSPTRVAEGCQRSRRRSFGELSLVEVSELAEPSRPSNSKTDMKSILAQQK